MLDYHIACKFQNIVHFLHLMCKCMGRSLNVPIENLQWQGIHSKTTPHVWHCSPSRLPFSLMVQDLSNNTALKSKKKKKKKSQITLHYQARPHSQPEARVSRVNEAQSGCRMIQISIPVNRRLIFSYAYGKPFSAVKRVRLT